MQVGRAGQSAEEHRADSYPHRCSLSLFHVDSQLCRMRDVACRSCDRHGVTLRWLSEVTVRGAASAEPGRNCDAAKYERAQEREPAQASAASSQTEGERQQENRQRHGREPPSR